MRTGLMASIGVITRRRVGRPSISAVADGLVNAAILVLSVFHAWLLASHIHQGRMTDPAVAVRWVAGALILAGFLFLRRVGAPLLWSRRAVVLWLFVVLLHWHAIASPSALVPYTFAMPETITVAAGPVALGPVFAVLGFAILAARMKRRAFDLRALRVCPSGPSFAGVPVGGFAPQISSRPPPA
jgi:hypothetical protein